MNAENLINISTDLKRIEIKDITKEQQDELLSIVGILDVGALVLTELTELYNFHIMDKLNIEKISTEKLKDLAKLELPDWDSLIKSYTKLKSLLVNGNAQDLQLDIDKLNLTKKSTMQALVYLQSLTYVFEDKPRIILLN